MLLPAIGPDLVPLGLDALGQVLAVLVHGLDTGMLLPVLVLGSGLVPLVAGDELSPGLGRLAFQLAGVPGLLVPAQSAHWVGMLAVGLAESLTHGGRANGLELVGPGQDVVPAVVDNLWQTRAQAVQAPGP